MKVWILVFVVAVWMQLPAEGNAKSLHAAQRRASKIHLNPASNIFKRGFPFSSIAKRSVSSITDEAKINLGQASKIAKRWAFYSAQTKRDTSSEVELENVLREFMKDDEVKDFLKTHPLGAMISEAIDNDDEIPAEDKELVKALTILMMMGVDLEEMGLL